MTERKLTFHKHTFDGSLYKVPCNQCKNIVDDDETPFEDDKEMIERSLNHPSHCQHPLDFYWARNAFGPSPLKCHICDKSCFFWIFRHCSLCKIIICPDCLRNPPPLTIDFPKSHNHELTFLLRDVSFTCNACGMEGKRNPYVCLLCSFMVHKDCIYLPRVININRHDHRVSRVAHLPHGNWECGVCRKDIDCAHGAFTCLRCPGYAVHPKCATREDVWDGQELEDEPEEKELEAPFKVINETDIIHFTHEKHILRVSEDKAKKRCDGCILPINDDLFYKCVECDFCLHKTCANLPRKKRHFLNRLRLTLQVEYKEDHVLDCSSCGRVSNGFAYWCQEYWKEKTFFDIRCISISEPFHHELHPHPLYRISKDPAKCHGCNKYSKSILSCVVCDDYVLGMECATLPRKVKHRCDDHFLSLCQGVGNSSGNLWCDICERKTNPSVWYYTCDLCGVTLHVNCVLGDMYYLKEGKFGGGEVEIFSNNGVTRPICNFCRRRCKFPFFGKVIGDGPYLCSFECAK